MTHPEQLLWTQLRGKRLDNLKFRRQHGIGPYIVDFYCPVKNLVIEIDGETHVGSKAFAHDIDRQAYLENLNLKVVRFTNKDIVKKMNDVLECILEEVK